MKKRYSVMLLIFIVAIMILGSGLAIISFGKIGLPICEARAKAELECYGDFSGDSLRDISGKCYLLGFCQPTLVIHFCAPRTELGILDIAKRQYPNEYSQKFFQSYGIPFDSSMDYYTLGSGKDWITGGHSHRYCLAAQPDKLGVTDVYYVRVGAGW